MRTILNLAIALALTTGTVTLTGCEKKAKSEHEVTTKDKTPEGGTMTTEKKETTETTPPEKK